MAHPGAALQGLVRAAAGGLRTTRPVAFQLCGSSNLADDQPSTSGRTYSFNASSSSRAEDAPELRAMLLDAALRHVPERGWTASSLFAAARELNLSPAVTGILPRGEGELVEHWMEGANARCLQQLHQRRQQLLALPLEERLAAALRVRLEQQQPVMDSWAQALAVAAKPGNAPHSLGLMLKLVDEVWYALGDTSTDATWYSKRALLAGVYTTTSLYMLTDYSPGYADTWHALRRRVAEGLALEGLVAGAVAAGQGLGGGRAGGPSAAAATAAEQEPPPEGQAPEAAGGAAAGADGGRVGAEQHGGAAASAGAQ